SLPHASQIRHPAAAPLRQIVIPTGAARFSLSRHFLAPRAAQWRDPSFSLLCSTLCVLCVLTSVNSVLPSLFLAFLFRAAFWRVGPRSAVCAPRALRRGGGICFSLLPFSSLLFSFLLFSSLFFSSLCARRLPRPGRGDL